MSIQRKGRTLIKSRVSATGHERIFVKKKATFIICIISLLLIGVIFYGIHLNQLKEEAKKEAEEKRELELLYYEQNRAFWLTCNYSKIYSYYSFEDSKKNLVVISIYAYNNAQSKNKLTLDDFIAYISNEYDSNGKPMVYSRPQNVNDYIDWFFCGGDDLINEFEDYFISYLIDKQKPPYKDMSLEEVIANLEEYQKDPEFNPFMKETG